MHSIIITDDIKKSLVELLNSEHGKTAEICRLTGIPKDRISKWCSGKTKTISENDYKVILPHLRLPDKDAPVKSIISDIPDNIDKASKTYINLILSRLIDLETKQYPEVLAFIEELLEEKKSISKSS